MSLKTKLMSAAVSGLAIAAFSTFAAAQDSSSSSTSTSTDAPRQERPDGFRRHGGHGKGMRDGRGGMMGGFRDLNLTDAQKQQIQSIMAANRPDQSSFGEMKTLMDAKRSGTLTAEQQDRLKAIRHEGRAKNQQVHEQVMAVLTEEQRTQLAQKQKERQERREQFRQNRQQKSPVTDAPQSN